MFSFQHGLYENNGVYMKEAFNGTNFPYDFRSVAPAAECIQ